MKQFVLILEKKSITTFFVGALILIIVVFFKFLFNNHYLLFTDIGNDSYYQVYAYMKAINQQIRETGELGWSFKIGAGQFIPCVFIGSFFNWPLFFINTHSIPYGMTVAEVTKIIFTGFIFFNYLKIKQHSTLVGLFGGWIIMFSGFITITASWFNYFSYAAFLWCLWLFSLEKLKQNKISWLTLTSALVVTDQPFHLYLFCLFTIIYFILDGIGKEQLKTLSLKFITSILLGLSMSSTLVGANLYTIFQSPRIDQTYSMATKLSSIPPYQLVTYDELKTIFFRFFSNNIEGIGDAFTGAYYYVEAPLFFVSTCSILLLSQYLAHQPIKKYGWVGVLIIIVILFPFFRHTLWLYTGDYYRILSFAIAVLVFEVSLKVLDKIKTGHFHVNKKWLLGSTAIVLLGFLWFAKDNNTFFFIKSIAICLLCFFALYFPKRLNNTYVFITIFTVSMADTIIESYATLNLRPHLTANDLKVRKGFNDYSMEAISWLKQYDKGFYRIEKDFTSGDAIAVQSLNDAMIQGYNSTKQYTSFNHLSYVKYLTGLEVLDGVDEQSSRWLYCRMDRLDVLSNLSVKYIISNGTFNWSLVGHKPLKSFQNLKVYYNPQYVPFGSLFNNVITESNFNKLKFQDKKKAIESYLIIPSQTLQMVKDTNKENPPLLSFLKSNTELQLKKHSHNTFEGTVFIKSTALMYFPIPFDKGWRIKIDGIESNLFKANFGMSAALIKPGNHSISLKYQLPYRNLLLIWTVLGLCVFIVSIFNLKKYLLFNF